jgi:hypothetical protein
VNPDHLFLGSNKDNMRDCVLKGRISRGENVHTSKLTEQDVRDIRASSERPRHLAARYGIDRSHVWQIRSRKQWKYLK